MLLLFEILHLQWWIQVLSTSKQISLISLQTRALKACSEMWFVWNCPGLLFKFIEEVLFNQTKSVQNTNRVWKDPHWRDHFDKFLKIQINIFELLSRVYSRLSPNGHWERLQHPATLHRTKRWLLHNGWMEGVHIRDNIAHRQLCTFAHFSCQL